MSDVIKYSEIGERLRDWGASLPNDEDYSEFLDRFIKKSEDSKLILAVLLKISNTLDESLKGVRLACAESSRKEIDHRRQVFKDYLNQFYEWLVRQESKYGTCPHIVFDYLRDDAVRRSHEAARGQDPAGGWYGGSKYYPPRCVSSAKSKTRKAFVAWKRRKRLGRMKNMMPRKIP